MLQGVPLDLAGPQGLGLLVLAGTAASVINTMAGGGGLPRCPVGAGRRGPDCRQRCEPRSMAIIEYMFV